MLYIYLHGFNSAYDSNLPKVQELSHIGNVIGITYNTFDTYENIHAYLVSSVPGTDEEFAFVGTSLGGYWAAEMGRYFAVPSVIINPCYDPRTMLMKYVGVPSTNYLTGEINTLTVESVESYPHPIQTEHETYFFSPLVLLDLGDETINSFQTIKTLSNFTIHEWVGGSHRFDHMKEALPYIHEYTNLCSFVEQLNV